MVTKATLQQVYFDNLRANQIGVTDGMSPEVAADLGFSTPDTIGDVLADFERAEIPARTEKIARVAGKVICGDCAQVIPCRHAGDGFTKGA